MTTEYKHSNKKGQEEKNHRRRGIEDEACVNALACILSFGNISPHLGPVLFVFVILEIWNGTGIITLAFEKIR